SRASRRAGSTAGRCGKARGPSRSSRAGSRLVVLLVRTRRVVVLGAAHRLLLLVPFGPGQLFLGLGVLRLLGHGAPPRHRLRCRFRPGGFPVRPSEPTSRHKWCDLIGYRVAELCPFWTDGGSVLGAAPSSSARTAASTARRAAS